VVVAVAVVSTVVVVVVAVVVVVVVVVVTVECQLLSQSEENRTEIFSCVPFHTQNALSV